MNQGLRKYTERVKIYTHYTNYKGRLFIKILSDLFNDAAEKHTEILGIDVATLMQEDKTWMLYSIRTRIEEMPVKGEEVVVETWVSGIDRFLALRDFRILNREGKVLAEAASRWMCIDIHRRRLVRLTPLILETGRNIPSELQAGNLPPLWEDDSIFERRAEGGRSFEATFDNIDFNGHVTQASYIRWMTNALPFEFLKNHVLTDIHVEYRHEIMPEHTIVSDYRTERRNDRVFVYHKILPEAGGREHCVGVSCWKETD